MIVMPTSEEGGAGNEDGKILANDKPGGNGGEADQNPDDDWRSEESIRQDTGDCCNEEWRQRLVVVFRLHKAIVLWSPRPVNGERRKGILAWVRPRLVANLGKLGKTATERHTTRPPFGAC